MRKDDRVLIGSGDVAMELVKILGLDGKRVRSLTFNIETDAIATVRAECIATEPQALGVFRRITEEYVLVKRDVWEKVKDHA